MSKLKKTTKVHKHKPVANRNRKVHKAHGSLMLILWAFLIVTAVLLVAGYIKHRSPLAVNEKGVSLRVNKVSYDDVGVPPFKVPPGWKIMIVHTVVKNHTPDIFHFAPVLQTYVADSGGHRYYMSPTILNDPIVAGPISPNDDREGSLSYLVPAKDSNLTLKFQF
jgi:hypothetical protein